MSKLFTIENEVLSVCVSDRGAELMSIKSSDGTQYLWQGDATYWADRDPNLFPYVGRLNSGKYRYQGKEYEMSIHGFCVGTPFEMAHQEPQAVRFRLTDTEATRKNYPFRFCLEIEYRLAENRLRKTVQVTNTGSEEMIFGLGSHPGFQVPLGGDGCFEDWYLEFPDPHRPLRMGFDRTSLLLNDDNRPFPLEKGTRLPLRHDLFDEDAIVLQTPARAVTLSSEKSRHSLTVDFPDMNYLGIWHMPKTDAPYVCIEPWLSLPSHHAYMEDLAQQQNLVHLPAGQVYTNTITMTFR